MLRLIRCVGLASAVTVAAAMFTRVGGDGSRSSAEQEAINESFMLALKRGQVEFARHYWSNGADPNESKYTGSYLRKKEGAPLFSPLQWLIGLKWRIVLPLNMQKFGSEPPS